MKMLKGSDGATVGRADRAVDAGGRAPLGLPAGRGGAHLPERGSLRRGRSECGERHRKCAIRGCPWAMRRAQHSSPPVGENPNSGKPKVRSNLYLADFEGGPLSTVTILSSIETSTSTVDIRRSENLLSTNYLSSFLLSATHRLVRGDAERRGGRGATVWRRVLSAFSPTHPRSKPCALARGPGGASRGTRTCRGGEI